MICPFCSNNDSIVIFTQKFTPTIRRVRACQKCGMAWRTYEDGPVCGGCGNRDTDVINSEKFEKTVTRTRRCVGCMVQWKTFETVNDDYGVIDFNENFIEEEEYRRKRPPTKPVPVRQQMSLSI